MNRDESTSHPLDTHAPVLSKSQKAVLWRKIEAALPDAAVPSPYLFSFVTVRPMAPIALVVALLLGVGGTAAASEQARPGDLLFPVDRALEDVRLALARNDNTRAELQIKFAEERLAELRSILAEADDDFDRNIESETSSNPTDDSVSEDSNFNFEAEADVFTDTTIVKVEINDRKTTFETDADTRVEVIDVIVDRFEIDRATVEAVLDFEIEGRASRVDDSDSNQSDGDREDSDDDSSDDDDFDDSDHRVRIEVRVEDGRAEVRMEYDGKRDEFETSYVSKTALIAALSARSGLSTGVISENLDLEIKD